MYRAASMGACVDFRLRRTGAGAALKNCAVKASVNLAADPALADRLCSGVVWCGSTRRTYASAASIYNIVDL